MKIASVFMDVEDPVNPLADDAAGEIAALFSEAGVRGSFCLTGEKCRTLLTRGRFDVIEALRPHCLGLHTDTHSVHPTTMELLEDCDFEEGCERAYEAEKRGFDAFSAAFGRPPAFWGGAGNTWSPEITEALKRLGISACSYALTFAGGRIHRFNGVTALPQHLSISEDDWADDERADARSERAFGSLHDDWTGLFVGHPTRMRYAEFWDKSSAGGQMPETPEFVEPVEDAVYERSKRNLRSFLSRLKEVVRIVGVDEIPPMRFEKPTAEELDGFRRETARALREAVGWPIHRPGLDASRIVDKTLALAATLEIGRQFV
ncbi:MAG TPA: hypothetical protein VHE55_13090 [Fimbriimonadaceae bacterium]|nr:hypothetical protein [Fimbriimonadaceae bacterium]